jgi:hypothetical protein
MKLMDGNTPKTKHARSSPAHDNGQSRGKPFAGLCMANQLKSHAAASFQWTINE